MQRIAVFLQRKSKNLDCNVVRPMLRWVYSTESGVSGRGFPFFPRRFLIAGYRIFYEKESEYCTEN